MATKLEIINRALGWLGQPPINDPENPQNNAGKSLVNIYNVVRQGVLASYLWNFAEVTSNTPRLGDSESIYTDDYLYPQKCLKLLKVITDDGCRITNYRLGYNVASDARVIQLSNQGKSTLKVVYNYDMENLFHWSPLACEVFALELAIGGVNAILGKENKMIVTLNELISEKLKDAIMVDGQEQKLAVEEIYQTEQARLGVSDSGLNIQFP